MAKSLMGAKVCWSTTNDGAVSAAANADGLNGHGLVDAIVINDAAIANVLGSGSK